MSVVTLGSLLFDLPAERRKPVRELEKVSIKIIKAKCSLLKFDRAQNINFTVGNTVVSISSHDVNELT